VGRGAAPSREPRRASEPIGRGGSSSTRSATHTGRRLVRPRVHGYGPDLHPLSPFPHDAEPRPSAGSTLGTVWGTEGAPPPPFPHDAEPRPSAGSTLGTVWEERVLGTTSPWEPTGVGQPPLFHPTTPVGALKCSPLSRLIAVFDLDSSPVPPTDPARRVTSPQRLDFLRRLSSFLLMPSPCE